MDVTLQYALRDAKTSFRLKGIESWALDADLLMCRIMGLTRAQLITHGNLTLNDAMQSAFYNLVVRRLAWEPIQYIVNRAEFMGIELYVDKNVLIPRPDTECVTELAIGYINSTDAGNILDMCTGSGCIAIAIALHCGHIEGVLACDISPAALNVANQNIKKNKVAHKVKTIETDMFQNIPKTYKFDVIVSNPPYIGRDELNELSENVAGYEPGAALFGGDDGLDFYRRISQGSADFLADNGRIFVEIGAAQKKQVIDIFKTNGFVLDFAQKDLAGLDRAVVFHQPQNRI